MNSVYQINKGVNASIEFKGLQAQYIAYFGGMLLALLILFAVLYIIGLSPYLCIALIGSAGGFGAFKIFRLSHVYGPHGMMKLIARKRMPKVLRTYTRTMFY
jgi:uncharacterized membrane protein